MKVLIVNHQEVQQWLSMSECVEAMADVFKMLNRGNAVNPLRNLMWLPDKSGLIGMMPAYLGDARVMGLKAISVFPGNHATEYDSHQGTVMLFETQNGRLLAMMDAGKITAKSKLFVDRRESTLNEAGDFLFPKKEGAINDDHVLGEIGDILLDKIKGRASKKDTTLFKSLGLAVEDVAAAHHIYQKLSEQGGGRWVEFNATNGMKSEQSILNL